METRLMLVRHGASRHMEDGIVGGPRGCRGLTAVGRGQAEHLARRLGTDLQDRPAAVYCSILPRAVETAEILAAALDVPDVIRDCGLCTWHTPPEVDGRPKAEFRREMSVAGGGAYRPFEQGNESWSELVSRTGRALEQISARRVGETVVIVTHAEAVQSSLIVFGGLPLVPGFDMFVAPTSITEWTTNGDAGAWPRPRWTLVRFNDSAHLSPKSGWRGQTE
jgi:probable phosphoglycerate mutase